jgi:hypothetical protein
LQETVQSLKLRACAEFGVEPESIEFWDFHANGKYANLESQMDKTLDEARIQDTQTVLLDEKVSPSFAVGRIVSRLCCSTYQVLSQNARTEQQRRHCRQIHMVNDVPSKESLAADLKPVMFFCCCVLLGHGSEE